MRIGLDMLGVQSLAPGADRRAWRSYVRRLVPALLKAGADHDLILYGHGEHPCDAIPVTPRVPFVLTDFGQAPGSVTPANCLERLAEVNPDGLDWLVLLDPFNPSLGFAPPARPLDGPKLAAVVADFTPYLLPERDLADPRQAERGYRTLERLRHYDAILTPTATARADGLKLLGLPPDRIHAIGAAADAAAFTPEVSLPMPLAARHLLHDLGIHRAFLLADVGLPGQRGAERVIDAFRRLPERRRLGYQLVLMSTAADASIERARAAVESLEDPEVVLADASPETTLRTLFQHCAVFIHPALHTGFGQPILEAMLCGAAVVAGDNSAQAELVGNAGLLADPFDPGALSAQTARILDDWPLSQGLRRAALARAGKFTIESAAANLVAALERTTPPRRSPRLRADRPHRSRPRLAVFSPFPPRISGIADYTVRLIEELKASYTIDLYHDTGYLPDLGLTGDDFATHDARLFDRNHATLDYHAIVYQMGNSLDYHGYLYEMLLRHPGVVTLHDFFLSVYPYRGTRRGDEVLASFRREIRHFCPDRAEEFLPHLEAWCEEEGGLAAACARRGLFLNRRVFESSLGVVVHSPWCLDQVRAWMPEHAGRTAVIPLGMDATERPAADRSEIRARFALPRDGLILSSFGFISPDKLVPEALEAFQSVARVDDSAWYLCVGEERDGGEARQRAGALGIADRVRFLGRQPADAYADLIAITDLGINLRRPPTNGETSGALLNLLAAGVATVVTDVGTFADYPDAVVRKVPWDARGPEELRRALHALAIDRPAREALGRAARSHVREFHAWPRAAALYAELIERCAAERRAALRSCSRIAHPVHYNIQIQESPIIGKTNITRDLP